MGYSALTARDLDTMPGNAGSHKRVFKDYAYHKEEDDDDAIYKLNKGLNCVDERVALANFSLAKLTLDTEENKTILKQLKKANASLTQELKECKTNLDESSRALGEATSSRDSSLIALQTKQTELEKYTALNDLTSDYKILQTKLNETLGLLARKDIDIKEERRGEESKRHKSDVIKRAEELEIATRVSVSWKRRKSRSKLDKDTVKPYNYTYQNSLYETFKPPSKAYLDQLERAKEVRKTMWRKTFVRTKPNIAKNFRPRTTTTRDVVEMSSSGPGFLHGQKASDYDNSDPVSPRQNVVPQQKSRTSLQKGKNIKRQRLYSVWIRCNAGRTSSRSTDKQSGNLIRNKPFGMMFINCSLGQQLGIFVGPSRQSSPFPIYQHGRVTNIGNFLMVTMRQEVYVAQPDGSLIQIIHEKVYLTEERKDKLCYEF
ncbi:hypothetical protein Tco_0591117 [Tanacetum coccineum]